MNVLQRIGGAIGTAVLAVVLQRAGGSRAIPGRSWRSAFDTAYWWALGIAALSLIPCVVLLRAETPAGSSSAATRRRICEYAERRGARRVGCLGPPCGSAAGRHSPS